jgi:threonine/homoserine/homoserine lactone efflux protein
MPLESWLLYVATCFAATLTPGPAVLMTMSVGLRGGVLPATLTGTGVCAANAIWITLSVAGLSAVLLASTTLFLVLKWAGALYLIYIGIRLLLKRSAGDAGAATGPAGARGAFARGFAVQLTNPKAMIFFGALVPQFVRLDQPLLLQGLILAVTLIVIEQLVLTGYGALAAGGSRLAGHARWTLVTEKTSGALMIGAGLGLASLRRG